MELNLEDPKDKEWDILDLFRVLDLMLNKDLLLLLKVVSIRPELFRLQDPNRFVGSNRIKFKQQYFKLNLNKIGNELPLHTE